MSIASPVFRPRGLAVVAGASLALFAQTATSATINVDSVTGVWTGVSISNSSTLSGLNTNAISWGTPAVTGGSKSGYTFVGVAPPPVPVATNVSFNLGTFTHINNPIFAPSIDAATLRVDFVLDINGTSTGVLSSIFNFSHWETVNDDNPCANGGAQGAGVNVNGCADRVTFALNPSLSDSFLVDGTEYFLNISSFLVGGSPASEFWTKESATNGAGLQGRIVERTSVVPIPAAAWLLGSGLVGLFGLARRKQQVAA